MTLDKKIPEKPTCSLCWRESVKEKKNEGSMDDLPTASFLPQDFVLAHRPLSSLGNSLGLCQVLILNCKLYIKNK